MEKQLADEIVGCLPQGRTCFNVPRFLAGKRSKIARNWPLYELRLEALAA
ncbi:hypothetical protein [Andreprevotia chitinilytica]|nr:hypothetical protein [Andreprevotia chitinilytica]